MASYLTPVQSKYRDNVTQTRPGSNRQGIEAENRCVHRPCNVCTFKIYIYIYVYTHLRCPRTNIKRVLYIIYLVDEVNCCRKRKGERDKKKETKTLVSCFTNQSTIERTRRYTTSRVVRSIGSVARDRTRGSPQRFLPEVRGSLRNFDLLLRPHSAGNLETARESRY